MGIPARASGKTFEQTPEAVLNVPWAFLPVHQENIRTDAGGCAERTVGIPARASGKAFEQTPEASGLLI